MKKYFILVCVTALMACGGSTKQTNAVQDSLTKANSTIHSELNAKDSIINTKEDAMTEFISSFNEIQENLNQIKAKEKIISTNSKSNELKKSNKDQIISDVQLIYGLLEKNKKKVADLSKKLKDSNLKIDDLEKAVTNLTNELEDKETEIADLKMKLEGLSSDFKNLMVKYDSTKTASEMKTEKLNSAWYVTGTTQELRKNGVITKEGGFIGMGKVAELNTTLDPGYFTKIDITKTTKIALSAKKVKLITSHPEGSYKLVEGASSINRIEILDPEKFWSISKYLIIATDRKKDSE